MPRRGGELPAQQTKVAVGGGRGAEALRGWLRSVLGWALASLALVASVGAVALAPPSDAPVVVIDPGHGGADFGARGDAGVLEKHVVLAVSRRIGRRLTARGFTVVFTREGDEFVSLPERTEIANRARGDLFLSIHANSAASAEVEGPETYFLSVEASDAEAMRVAMIENEVFRQEGTSPDDSLIVGEILGDLIRTEHLRVSSDLAAAIQRSLSALGVNRGVKQAPFVVLVGVNMPAALIELGFLTHPKEEQRLGRRGYQSAMADAIAVAVATYYEPRARADRKEALQVKRRADQ